MAISEVQVARAGNTTQSLDTTFPSTPAAGNLLVIMVVVAEAASPTFDTPSGWTSAFTPGRGALFYKVAGAGESQIITVTIQGGTNRVLRSHAWELAGANTASPFDQSGSGAMTSATTAAVTTAGATDTAAEWACVGVGMNGSNGGGESVDNSFSLVSTTDVRRLFASKVLSATGTIATNAGWTTSRTGTWIIGTFRAAATSLAQAIVIS